MFVRRVIERQRCCSERDHGLGVQFVLFQVWGDARRPTGERRRADDRVRRRRHRHMARRKCIPAVVMLVQGNANLFEAVLAIRPRGGHTDALHGRKQQADEYRNDADDREEFDQSKAASATRFHPNLSTSRVPHDAERSRRRTANRRSATARTAKPAPAASIYR